VCARTIRPVTVTHLPAALVFVTGDRSNNVMMNERFNPSQLLLSLFPQLPQNSFAIGFSAPHLPQKVRVGAIC